MSISDLSPEVLLLIFDDLQDSLRKDFREQELWSICSPRSYSWIAITRVCQFWRNATLGCPKLWRDINEDYCPEVVEAFLKRSGTTLLSIRRYVFDDHSYQTLRTILTEEEGKEGNNGPRLNRIQSLQVAFHEERCRDVDVILSTFPNLERLILDTREYQVPTTETIASQMTLVGFQAPGLKVVDLTTYGLNASSNFRQLTHLELGYPQLRLTVPVLTKIVHDMSRLRVLNILNALDPPTIGLPPTVAVDWPALSELAIQDSEYCTSLALLQAVRFPPLTSIKTSIHGDDVPGNLTGIEAFTAINEAYNEALGRTLQLSNSSISVSGCMGEPLLEVEISKAFATGRELDEEPGVLKLILALSGAFTQADGAQIASELLLSSDSKALSRLILINVDLTYGQWTTVVRGYPLKFLSLKGSATYSFLNYLVEYYTLNPVNPSTNDSVFSDKSSPPVVEPHVEDKLAHADEERLLLQSRLPLPLTLEMLIIPFKSDSENPWGLHELKLAQGQALALNGQTIDIKSR